MKRAFFVFSATGYFRESYPLVPYFIERGYDVTVLIEWAGAEAEAAKERCHQLGCTVVAIPETMLYRPSAVSDENFGSSSASPDNVATASRFGSVVPGRSWKRRLARWLPFWPVLARLARFALMVRSLLRVLKVGTALFKKVNPDVMLFGPINSCDKVATALFTCAVKQNKLLVCYPFTTHVGTAVNVASRIEAFHQNMFGQIIDVNYDIINRVLAYLLPGWIRASKGVRIFARDPLLTVASRLVGLIASNGWDKPSTKFDLVFVPIEESVDYFRMGNYPLDRVIVSGFPRIDQVYLNIKDDQYMKKFFSNLGLPFGGEFIVLNVEPSAEHNYDTWEGHWKNLDNTLSQLLATGMPVVLSLHPLCDFATYRKFAKKRNAICVNEYNIYDLIASCRVVVASVCSTNFAADLFNKPLIIYDYYNLLTESAATAQFYRREGVPVCITPEQLEPALNGVMESSRASKTVDAPQRQLACQIIVNGIEAHPKFGRSRQAGNQDSNIE